MEQAAGQLPHIIGAVVTFNPSPNLLTNLRALRDQLAHVVVIDNGSTNIGLVEAATRETGCRLVTNDRNFGIGAALNQGARMAQAEGFEWLAAFDQDSLAPEGACAGLLELYERHPQKERIGVLSMSHRDRAIGRGYHAPADILEDAGDWRSLKATITSGSLVPVRVLNEVGLFEDRLFIDAVDLEFCLRCRKGGFLVVESTVHALEHSIGEATLHSTLGGRRIWCTNHSPMRRYYITRNYLEVATRYLTFDPRWAKTVLSSALLGGAGAVLLEERRLAKGRAIVRGVCDYLLRRFGPRHAGLLGPVARP